MKTETLVVACNLIEGFHRWPNASPRRRFLAAGVASFSERNVVRRRGRSNKTAKLGENVSDQRKRRERVRAVARARSARRRRRVERSRRLARIRLGQSDRVERKRLRGDARRLPDVQRPNTRFRAVYVLQRRPARARRLARPAYYGVASDCYKIG